MGSRSTGRRLLRRFIGVIEQLGFLKFLVLRQFVLRIEFQLVVFFVQWLIVGIVIGFIVWFIRFIVKQQFLWKFGIIEQRTRQLRSDLRNRRAMRSRFAERLSTDGLNLPRREFPASLRRALGLLAWCRLLQMRLPTKFVEWLVIMELVV